MNSARPGVCLQNYITNLQYGGSAFRPNSDPGLCTSRERERERDRDRDTQKVTEGHGETQKAIERPKERQRDKVCLQNYKLAVVWIRFLAKK